MQIHKAPSFPQVITDFTKKKKKMEGIEKLREHLWYNEAEGNLGLNGLKVDWLMCSPASH